MNVTLGCMHLLRNVAVQWCGCVLLSPVAVVWDGLSDRRAVGVLFFCSDNGHNASGLHHGPFASHLPLSVGVTDVSTTRLTNHGRHVCQRDLTDKSPTTAPDNNDSVATGHGTTQRRHEPHVCATGSGAFPAE